MSAAPQAPADAGPDRLAEVEIRLTWLDDLVEVLNATVFRQQQQIDLLTQALVELRAQVRSAESGPGTDPRDEIPPHY